MKQQSGINVEVLNATLPNFKEQDKGQAEKFGVSYSIADEDNLKTLEKYGVKIKKPSQVIVLAYTKDERDFDRDLKLAEEMGFIDAYRQNPRHLSQPVEEVIKRMSKAEALGMEYKDEKGRYAQFLFGERISTYAFNKRENELAKESPSDAPINSDSQVDSAEMAEIKDDALRVLEAFAMTDEKDQIFARLDAIGDKGLSEKEMLVEAFKIFGGDEKLLISTIDDVLAASEEVKRGRAA